MAGHSQLQAHLISIPVQHDTPAYAIIGTSKDFFLLQENDVDTIERGEYLETCTTVQAEDGTQHYWVMQVDKLYRDLKVPHSTFARVVSFAVIYTLILSR